MRQMMILAAVVILAAVWRERRIRPTSCCGPASRLQTLLLHELNQTALR